MLRRPGRRDGLRRPGAALRRAQRRRLARGRRQARSSCSTRTTTSPSPRTTRSTSAPTTTFEIVLGVELVAELIREGRLALDVPVERTVTYHDPCRLNKRKGIWTGAARDPARDPRPRRSSDVDRVTQWSYCSGGGGGLPIEKPEITAEISRAAAGAARPSSRSTRWSAPARGRSGRCRQAGEARAASTSSTSSSCSRESLGIERRRQRRAASRTRGVRARVDDARRSTELRAGPRRPSDLITSQARADATARACRRRSRSTAGPTTCPTSVVLPDSTEEVAEVVKLANRLRHPGRARAPAAPGSTDGAVPLRGGILRRRQADEPDPRDRPRGPHRAPSGRASTCSSSTRSSARTALIYPDDPASYPCSLVGGRIGTERLVAARLALRPHARPRAELDRGRAADRRDRPRSARAAARKLAQELDRLHAQAAVHGPPGHARASPPRRRSKLVPRSRRRSSSPFWAFDDYDERLPRAPARWPGPAGDDRRRRALRRVEGRLPAPRRRGLHPAARRACARSSARSLYGNEDEVEPAARRMHAGRARARRRATSATRSPQGDWAARHDRYATPLHGRTQDGPGRADELALRGRGDQLLGAARRSREEWHAIVAELRRERTTSSTTGACSPTPAAQQAGVDYLIEIDVGIWEQELDDETWATWVRPSARSPRSRSSTAARSPPATAPAARARSTSCPTSWAAATR